MKKKTKKVTPKTTKITDVADPGKTAPSATSRPIVVTNRPVLTNDPMMVNSEAPDIIATAAPTIHTSKTLNPVSAEEQTSNSSASDTAAEQPDSASSEAPEPSLAQDDARAEAEDASAEAKEARERAAEEARNRELEQLVESGTYNVPINAVQRKRSHMFVAGMCLLAIVLAVVLFDIVLDVGIVDISFIPHTNFF